MAGAAFYATVDNSLTHFSQPQHCSLQSVYVLAGYMKVWISY